MLTFLVIQTRCSKSAESKWRTRPASPFKYLVSSSSIATADFLRVAAQFYPSNQPGGHSLAPISGLGQTSPPQNSQGGPPQPLAPQMQHQPPPQGSAYALPAIGSVQHQQGQAEADRDRMMRQREMDERLSVQRDAAEREREREREQHRNREAQRAADARDQYEINERQRRIESQSQPHQNHAGSIPIHQPVASKVPSTIHGPGGLLSGMGGGGGPVPSTASMTASNGPSGGFGPPSANSGQPRPMQQNPLQNQLPQHRLMQAPGAMTGLTQGQQPILNVSNLAREHEAWLTSRIRTP